MNEVLNCIKTRRSIKKYKDAKVSQNDINLILEAGTYAPTGRNLQSPVIVAVSDKKTVAKLSELNAKILGIDGDPFYGAPVVLVVLADSEINTYIEDASLVMGNMMLAAHSLGLGACWIHRAKEMFELKEGKELLHKWGLSDKYVGVGNCIIGYADAAPELRPRKEGYIIKV